MLSPQRLENVSFHQVDEGEIAAPRVCGSDDRSEPSLAKDPRAKSRRRNPEVSGGVANRVERHLVRAVPVVDVAFSAASVLHAPDYGTGLAARGLVCRSRSQVTAKCPVDEGFEENVAGGATRIKANARGANALADNEEPILLF